MIFKFGRAAVATLLFLGTQVAPGLHAAFEAGHDLHVCCTDDETAAHFDACGADHDAPPCHLCATVRAPASVVLESASLSCPVVELPSPVAVAASPADPFRVATPHTRGPPA